MIFFVDISWELTRRVRTQIFSKCRKSAIPLYAEARQFHLLQVPCNFWIRLSFLNKHLTFSEGFRRIFSENLRKFQTAGYLVFSKPYPAAGYVDTDNKIPNQSPWNHVAARHNRRPEILRTGPLRLPCAYKANKIRGQGLWTTKAWWPPYCKLHLT